jgi:hypothetical protein
VRNVVGDKMEAAKPRGNGSMSKRIDKSWLVFISIENFEHNRCVDLFLRPDGSCGFEEFRRDAEDRATGPTPVLLRLCLWVAGGCACGGNAIRRVVAGWDRPKPLRTKIAARASRLIPTLTVARASERKRDVASWPIMTFRDNAALRSLSERSGHQLVGKTRSIGRE